MPRTKPGTRANRSCASRDQAGRGPFPFPVSPFSSSKASSRPVVTIPLTVSSGCESIGGTTIDSQPLETVRGMVTTGRDDAFEDENGETGKGKGPLPAWSREAQERLARVPGFVRGMVKRIYLDYAKDRGIAEITPAVMDTARSELGLEGM